MSVEKHTPQVAAKYFRIDKREDGLFHLYDLGTSRRSQSFGAPQYTGDKYPTLEAAEAGVRERAGDRGDL